MRGLNLIGILLLVLGIALAATRGSSFEKRVEVLQAQNVDVHLKDQKRDNWPWLAGTAAVIGGVVIFILKGNKREG